MVLAANVVMILLKAAWVKAKCLMRFCVCFKVGQIKFLLKNYLFGELRLACDKNEPISIRRTNPRFVLPGGRKI